MNWTINKKLWAGYLSLVFIILLFGIFAYVMFGKIDTNVEELSFVEVPLLREFDSVEKSTMKASREQSNYDLYRTQNSYEQMLSQSTRLLEALGKAEIVAKKHSLQGVVGKIADLRENTNQITKKMSEIKQIFKEEDLALNKMVLEGGNILEFLQKSFDKNKKNTYASLADIQKELIKIEKRSFVAFQEISSMENTIFQALLKEKEYLKNGEEDAYNAVLENLKKAKNHIRKLQAVDDKNMESFPKMLAELEQYHSHFLSLKESHEKEVKLQKDMRFAGNKIAEESESYSKDIYARVRKMDVKVQKTQELEVLDVVSHIEIAILHCRRWEEKLENEKYYESIKSKLRDLNHSIDKLERLEKRVAWLDQKKFSSELRSLHQKYKTNIDEWYSSNKELRKQLKYIEKDAADILKQAHLIKKENAKAVKKDLNYVINVILKKLNTYAYNVTSTGEVLDYVLRARVNELHYMRSKNEKFHNLVKTWLGKAKVTLKELAKNESELASDITDRVNQYLTASDQWHDAHNKARKASLEQGKKAADLMRVVEKAKDDRWNNMEQQEKNLLEAVIFGNTSIVVSIFIALIVGISLAVFMSQHIGGLLSRLSSALGASSQQVASASAQISTSSQQVSGGASEQASTMEEISSSLEEMASMTKQNASNASEAEKLAKDTQKHCEKSNQSMEKLKESIYEVSVSSNEMEGIIKSIEEIASQTNLLALNAAVEAAKAGEHGRGFAVVADEVRNLAQKSAESAKSTAALIMENSRVISDSTRMAEDTEKSLQEILEQSTKTAELVAEISAASQEQSQGISQVTTSIVEMDKVVQENAASSEETASVSEELNAQSVSLNNLVRELNIMIGNLESDLQKDFQAARIMHQSAKKIVPHRELKTFKPKVDPKEVFPLNDEEFKDF